ncbi:MAG: hypothetical protein IJC84_02235 [Clostridia bacterium]|nr:hypothetical protein [Clostridia bacterium]
MLDVFDYKLDPETLAFLEKGTIADLEADCPDFSNDPVEIICIDPWDCLFFNEEDEYDDL